MKCFCHLPSLREVCIPSTLRNIARRAFAGCTQLRTFYKTGKSTTWRGPYARVNAFDKCEQRDKPKWLRFRQMPKTSGEKTSLKQCARTYSCLFSAPNEKALHCQQCDLPWATSCSVKDSCGFNWLTAKNHLDAHHAQSRACNAAEVRNGNLAAVYLLFPRVRTPCGHGAQVIIEGREIQSDGGEKDKDNPTTNQTKPTTAHRPRLHHQVVFPLY